MTTGERALAFLLTLIGGVLLAAWLTEPPRHAPAGAVPTPTAVVQRNEAVESALCGYVRAAPAEGTDLAYVGEASRDPRIRFALAMAASRYALDGSAGARAQLIDTCTRSGHG